MAYWSIACRVRDSIQVPEVGQLLEPGLNVFTIVTDDLGELLDRLSDGGAEMLAVNRLDDEVPDASRSIGKGGPGITT